MNNDLATELRAVVNNTAFQQVMHSLEQDAFNQFMALNEDDRHAPKGRKLIAHIDALRDVRQRLDFLANTPTAAPHTVV